MQERQIKSEASPASAAGAAGVGGAGGGGEAPTANIPCDIQSVVLSEIKTERTLSAFQAAAAWMKDDVAV